MQSFLSTLALAPPLRLLVARARHDHRAREPGVIRVRVTHAEEVLEALASGWVDLAVIHPDVQGMTPLQLVAAARTAGLSTPFLLMVERATAELRRQVIELRNVALIERRVSPRRARVYRRVA